MIMDFGRKSFLTWLEGLKERIEKETQMSQRTQDRLEGNTSDDEILVRALQTGEFTDQFTTIPPEDPKAVLNRIPKCMHPIKRKKEDE